MSSHLSEYLEYYKNIATIKVRVAQKLYEIFNSPETKDENDIPKGIVKWLVEILDETEEPIVGVATILTMVKI